MNAGARYNVVLSRRAFKDLEKLDPTVRRRIIDRLDELSENPYPKDCIKIHAKEGLYRLRVGDYRILYEINHQKQMILVIKIDHRRRIYRPI